jgi:hypothetical protein
MEFLAEMASRVSNPWGVTAVAIVAVVALVAHLATRGLLPRFSAAHANALVFLALGSLVGLALLAMLQEGPERSSRRTVHDPRPPVARGGFGESPTEGRIRVAAGGVAARNDPLNRLKGSARVTQLEFSNDSGSCIPRENCCKVCSRGQACGNSCISASYTCRKGRGCACDASEVCQ